MNRVKADGSVYSRSGNVSQSENSSGSICMSDPDDALVEEQEPTSSSVGPGGANSLGMSILETIRQNCPWAKRRYAPTLESLHEEMMDFYVWLRPTAEEIALRRAVFRRVQMELNLLYPNAQVNMFGSVATNLFLPTSDIDISVRLNQRDNQASPIDMYAIAEAFKLLDLFENVQIVDRTDVPIIKFRHKHTKYCIDMSFNKHQAVLSNVLWVNRAKYQYPELEPLTMLLKQYLAQRNLNHPFHGGLSSYGLILMVVAFLKAYSRDSIMGTALETSPLGLLLFEFFYYYGYQFDYDEMGVSARSRFGVAEKSALARQANEDKHAAFLFIEDPITRGNNVGKSSYNMMAIKTSFAQTYDSLRSALIQCQFSDYSQFYWGPMLSLFIPTAPEEINYRKWQRDIVFTNREILPPVNAASRHLSGKQPTTRNKANSGRRIRARSAQPQLMNSPVVKQDDSDSLSAKTSNFVADTTTSVTNIPIEPATGGVVENTPMSKCGSQPHFQHADPSRVPSPPSHQQQCEERPLLIISHSMDYASVPHNNFSSPIEFFLPQR